MAIVNLEVPFSDIHGTLVRNGIIHRQKQYKDDDGKVIFTGRQEAYAVRTPRDYKKNPPQGEELNNINIFREANRLTTELIHLDQELKAAQLSANHTEPTSTQSSNPTEPTDTQNSTPNEAVQTILQDPTKAEQLALLQDYKTRFKKQIKRADPLAPIDKSTHRRKQYRTLNTFIRAMLIQQLKSAQTIKNANEPQENP